MYHPDLFQNIFDLHKLLGVPTSRIPLIPAQERIDLRYRLIDEEVNDELLPALRRSAPGQDLVNLTAIADGICDAIVVLLGTAHEFGIPFDACWQEVNRTNMAKVGLDGKPIFRADGKFLKPVGWQPPNIHGILTKAIALAKQRQEFADRITDNEQLNGLVHEDQS